MSAAVVSGAAALVLEARPQLTPAQVKAALQLTASRVAGAGLIEAGAGSLNVAAAVELARMGNRNPVVNDCGRSRSPPAQIVYSSRPGADLLRPLSFKSCGQFVLVGEYDRLERHDRLE